MIYGLFIWTRLVFTPFFTLLGSAEQTEIIRKWMASTTKSFDIIAENQKRIQ